jgi:methyl-galactoside transport system substrate-binding protein
MKRIALFMCLLLAFVPAARAEQPKIAFLAYNTQDTFIASVISQVEDRAKGAAALTVLDAANNQNTQNAQLEAQLDAGADAVIVNAVDRTSAIYLIGLAMKYEKPIVFINREPLFEDLCLYDGAYYVGTDPKELGTICGQIVADYFLSHPEADKNGDDVIQYVLLKGQLGHQDAELRTLYSINALQDAGLSLEKLAEEDARWERTQGQEAMAGFLNEYGDEIECVISNNDDMALGAIDALKAAGYFSNGLFMPVVGVDATRQALEAFDQGTLLGTVLNNAADQGNAAFELALLLGQGESLDGYSYEMTNGKYIWIPGRAILAQ